MGCVSSKIMTKSLSFREELSKSLRRRTNGLEEITVSKNGGDQFVALLCTANTVARRLKEGSLSQQEPQKDSSLKHTNSTATFIQEPEKTIDVETINTWELLAGLEEDKEVEEEQREGGTSNEVVPSISIHKTVEDKLNPSNDLVEPSRRFHTVEDFDIMVAANGSLEGSQSSVKESIKKEGKQIRLQQESIQEGAILERNLSREKGSRRKAMAKELAALKVPGFEFSRSGSLREWLSLGGQVFSPGSYVTPKFGNFASPEANSLDNNNVFDPELVEQFEEAMKQLTMDEECILEEIIESLEREHEEDSSKIETMTEQLQS